MTVEELRDAGLTQMDDEGIRAFLDTRDFGVLGLQDEGVPHLLPMSFGYDGKRTLYFTFVVGEGSRKAELARATDRAVFLVYDAPSAFQWQSVLLTGTIERLPDDQRDEAADVVDAAWRPDLFEQADLPVEVYGFHVESYTGYQHAGLPPGFSEG